MKGHDIKIIIIGDSSTGKTSFVNRWISGKFVEINTVTINHNFNYKIIQLNKTIYRVQIWDIGGQDRSRCLAKFFVKGCHAVFIFSDITEKVTLDNSILWKNLLNDLPKEFNYSVILFQNKIDLVEKNKLNETQFEIKKFAEDNNFDSFFRISSKTNEGIDNAMNEIINEIGIKFINLNNKVNKDHLNKSPESFHLHNKALEYENQDINEKGFGDFDKNKYINNNINENKKKKCC